MIDAATFNTPNWVDLSTPDIDGAGEFYSELFGWDMSIMPSTMGDYHVAKVDDHEVAGLMEQAPQMKGQPASWTVFVYVADIEETTKLVAEHGGRVMQPPFEIPGGAKVAVIVDPTGAMLALIAGGETPDGVYFSDNAGAVCWVELLTRDPEAAAAFHREVFGWETVVDTSTETNYTVFKLDGEDVAGMLMMPDAVPAEAPSHWSTYFTVDDCDATVKMTGELGGEVLRPTTDISIGKFAVLADPQGATFEIMEFAS